MSETGEAAFDGRDVYTTTGECKKSTSETVSHEKEFVEPNQPTACNDFCDRVQLVISVFCHRRFVYCSSN